MIESRSNSGGICPEIAGSEAGEESSISCKSTSRSNKVSFASNVTAREITSPSLTGLPPTVSMVEYTGVWHSGVLRAFPDPAVLNVGRHFFSPPPHKLGAAKRETVSKISLELRAFRTGAGNRPFATVGHVTCFSRTH